jgi:acyl transferase domain-containing protein
MATNTQVDVTTPTEDPGWIPAPLYRMSLEQYEAMVASGVFTKRDRFHLIHGYLVARMT